MQKFTVISFNEEDGQSFCHHVWATCGQNAFASAAVMEPNLDLTLVVAMPGWLEQDNQLTFPGEGVVSAEAVRDDDDVFGKPAYELTASDIEEVLAANAVLVIDSKGKSFKAMAMGLHQDILEDYGAAIALGAMRAKTPAEIRPAALKEIAEALQCAGVLKNCSE